MINYFKVRKQKPEKTNLRDVCILYLLDASVGHSQLLVSVAAHTRPFLSSSWDTKVSARWISKLAACQSCYSCSLSSNPHIPGNPWDTKANSWPCPKKNA